MTEPYDPFAPPGSSPRPQQDPAQQVTPPSSPDPLGPNQPGPDQSGPGQPVPPQQLPPPGPPWGQMPAAPVRGPAMAIWALVLAFIPLFLTQIAAAVLALVVLLRGAGQKGRGLAVAALVVSGVWLVVGTIGLALLAASSEDFANELDLPDEGDVSVADLAVGDCTSSAPEGEMFTIDVVPCSQLHAGEVYRVFDLPDGDYPGKEAVDLMSDEGCFEAFESFVGIGYEESELDYYLLSPLESGWSFDRGVVCLVVGPDDVTGTLQDAMQ